MHKLVFALLVICIERCYSASCPEPSEIENAFTTCSKGWNHFSICKIECKKGYDLVGVSRSICWCRDNVCSWKGGDTTCKYAGCDMPSNDNGRVHLATKWSRGFAAVVQFEEAPLTIKHGWSIVIVFDKPLGRNVSVKSWNMELSTASYDRQTFTFVNSDHNFDLSRQGALPLRALFVLEYLDTDVPATAYAGMYSTRVRDASCVIAPRMHEMSFESINRNEPVKNIATIPSTQSSTTPLTKLYTAETTTTMYTTKRKTTKAKTTTKTTTAQTIRSTVGTTVNPVTQVNSKQERYCKLQRKNAAWKVMKVWYDDGQPFFDIQANMEVDKVINDWYMVLVFQEPVDDIEVWSANIVDQSPDNKIWTFGSLEWNSILFPGETSISVIGRKLEDNAKPVKGQVFLCSNEFTSGDAMIVISDGEESQEETTASTQSYTKKTTTTMMTTTVKTTTPIVAENPTRCWTTTASGLVERYARQTIPSFSVNKDGTKYNYNEVLHKSILFYEAQKSGKLPLNNRIPWRGDSSLKDGCDLGVDVSGGWYDGGNYIKFNFPMAFTLTALSWGGITFREAYMDAGELDNMLETVVWATKYFIQCHTSKYELIAQVGDPDSDHSNWGRPEELKMARPTYTINAKNPGTELAAEVSAALAASSIFLNETHSDLAELSLQHAKELYDFADMYRGSYDKSVPEATPFYESHSGYEDELLWAAAWLHKATNDKSYLNTAEKMHAKMLKSDITEFSWDSKLFGAEVLLSDSTGDSSYRTSLSTFLDSLQAAKTTPKGLYYHSEWAPNRYTGGAACIAVMASMLDPPLPNKDSHLKWAEKQIGLLLGDGGMSYVVGFGANYPEMIHHRASSCPPYPQSCNWDTYHSTTPNHYILYGALVGGPDEYGSFKDSRQDHKQNQVACDYNAGFQSAVAGLKYFAMKTRNIEKVTTPATSRPTTVYKPVPTTSTAHCLPKSPTGTPVTNGQQTMVYSKTNLDGTKHNYNEVLRMSILFYEAQRSGNLPTNNRIPWRGDSGLKDGCDIGVDATGGWYDGGNYIKFNLPMAYTLTTLSWGGIVFRDSYKDAGELENMENTVIWATEYFIKCHLSKYELIAQVGNPDKDHSNWGRPEEMEMDRPTYKITASKPGTELAAEVSAALASSSIFLKDSHSSLAENALEHAKQLYEFADRYRRSYHESVPEASPYYTSHSGYEDELLWAATWLHLATSDKPYLDAAEKIHAKIDYSNFTEFSWDSKLFGAEVLLANLTGDSSYLTPLSAFLDSLEVASTTTNGMYYHSEWAPNRYTGGAACIALMAATLDPPLPRQKLYSSWAEKQIGLLLGDAGMSYMIGFGSYYPEMTHHRASSCPPFPQPCNWETYHSVNPNHYILYGALVGGPNERGYFSDSRQDHKLNQVACDYNAGFQTAVAGLKHFAMQNRDNRTAIATTEPPTPTTRKITRCSRSSPMGSPVYNAKQTTIDFKPNTDDTKHNYNEVLHKSILFFEAQRSGKLPADNRIPWRGDSGLKDGCDVGVDATGGWFDAGDYVKFNFPMAFSLTTLAWGGIVFRDAYHDAGELEHLTDSIKWIADYLIRCHISKYELIAQVGKGSTAHKSWDRPETMNSNRPSYIITAKRPGSDLAAETSAALAASSVFLTHSDPELAKEARKHAKELYEFADKYRGKYHDSVPEAKDFYESHTGYHDELVWSAAWLYKATKDRKYLNMATANYNKANFSRAYPAEFSWDDKTAAVQLLLTNMTGGKTYRRQAIRFLDYIVNGKTNPQGLHFVKEWGSNRYAAGASLVALMASTIKPPLPKSKLYREWAEQQIGIILGDGGRSYVIGYGDNYPTRPHHRSSSCPPYPQRCDWSTFNSKAKNYYTLYGAMVGGPDERGNYRDERSNYAQAEVTCDYNAVFQSSVAGIKHYVMKNRPKTVTTTKKTTAVTTSLTTTVATTTKKKPKKPRRRLCRPRNHPKCKKWEKKKLLKPKER